PGAPTWIITPVPPQSPSGVKVSPTLTAAPAGEAVAASKPTLATAETSNLRFNFEPSSFGRVAATLSRDPAVWQGADKAPTSLLPATRGSGSVSSLRASRLAT